MISQLPLVSVIIATYNTQSYMLKESIESILSQSYQDFEIILIDDKSTDDIDYSFLSDYHDERIRFYQCEKNSGLAYCINWGIDLSKGKYIARLDADDIALPSRLAEQVRYMEKHKDTVVLASRGISFGDRCFVAGAIPSNPEYIRAGFLLNCGIIHSSVMLRKSYLIDNKVFYDASVDRAQDYDLWTRIDEHGDKIHMLKSCLCLYRIHDGQASNYQVSEAQKVCSTRIKRRVLSELYDPTEMDYKCQESLGFRRLVDGIFINDINCWMKKVFDINKKDRKYNQKYLKLSVLYKYCSVLRSNLSLKNMCYIFTHYPLEMIWIFGIVLYKGILKFVYRRYIPLKYK